MRFSSGKPHAIQSVGLSGPEKILDLLLSRFEYYSCFVRERFLKTILSSVVAFAGLLSISVPAGVLFVGKLPKTRSGKIVRLPPSPMAKGRPREA
jgi:hypothetical protein